MADLDKNSISERLSRHDSTGRKFARKNWAYSRYFEGYTEYKRTELNGRSRIIREYTADWYTCNESALRRKIRKLFYLISALMAFLIFVFLSIQPYAYNYSFGISLIQIAATFIGAWNVLSAIRFASSKTKMTIYEYKNIPSWIKYSSLGVCICYFLMACAVAYFGLTAVSMDTAHIVMATGGYMLSAVFTAGIYIGEKKTEYHTVPNERKANVEGYTIEN